MADGATTDHLQRHRPQSQAQLLCVLPKMIGGTGASLELPLGKGKETRCISSVTVSAGHADCSNDGSSALVISPSQTQTQLLCVLPKMIGAIQENSVLQNPAYLSWSFFRNHHFPTSIHPSILNLLQGFSKLKTIPQVFRNQNAFSVRDLQYYRSKFYGQDCCNKNLKKNLLFFSNKIESRPNGDLIDDIHRNWYGNYYLLEQHHGYIQWLFPIHESGVNFSAQVLQLHELAYLKSNPDCRHRALASFDMMLDFYGFCRLSDQGVLERTYNFKDRFRNLCNHTHNFLRITRILKFLGLMDMTDLQTGFVAKILEEVLLTGKLKSVASSLQNYWLPTLKDDFARAALEEIVERATLPSASKQVWCSSL